MVISAAFNKKNDKGVIAALLEYGADVSLCRGEFGSAIQAALDADHLEIAGLLIEAGADLEVEVNCKERLQKALELNEKKKKKKKKGKKEKKEKEKEKEK